VRMGESDQRGVVVPTASISTTSISINQYYRPKMNDVDVKEERELEVIELLLG
jgi:hypothetical protein